AIIQKDDRVLLCRRSQGETLAGFWEFPGGKVEKGETPEQCLQRELHEELNVQARIGFKCAESLHVYDHGSFRIIAYLVVDLVGELRPNVHDLLEWVKIADLSEYNILPADVPIAAFLGRQEVDG